VPFPFLDGPIGAASALKMSYAGITKGLTAVAVAMVLGATRGGSAAALHKELEMSQPQLLGWLTRQVPRMPPKAYRWVAEMEEIGHFVGDGTPGGDMYAAIAKLYEDIAAALRAPQTADNSVAQLAAFFEPAEAKERKLA
jgi:L-threonate 2-dehydrogenase